MVADSGIIVGLIGSANALAQSSVREKNKIIKKIEKVLDI